MSSFKIHEPLAKLPSTIEVDAIGIRQVPSKKNPPPISSKGIVYMDNGILKYKGTNGTITVLGNS